MAKVIGLEVPIGIFKEQLLKLEQKQLKILQLDLKMHIN